MEKFKVKFSDGSERYVWATDKKAAKFHLNWIEKKFAIKITKVEKAA